MVLAIPGPTSKPDAKTDFGGSRSWGVRQKEKGRDRENIYSAPNLWDSKHGFMGFNIRVYEEECLGAK